MAIQNSYREKMPEIGLSPKNSRPRGRDAEMLTYADIFLERDEGGKATAEK